MSSSTHSALPADFKGDVRLFPLPNLVMFPHGLQPLHVYEPRYCSLLEDALEGDHLMAIALLQPGWEADYEGRPPIFPVTCVGRVASHSQLEDGRHNILLKGLARVTVLREVVDQKPYRTAKVAVLEDVYAEAESGQREQMRLQLLRHFRELLPASAATQQLLDALQEKDVPLGVLTDIIAYTISVEIPFKYKLLREGNVHVRAKSLVDRLACLAEGGELAHAPFPPDFSEN